MSTTGPFQFADINGARFTIDRDPNICPLCHKSVLAKQVAWTLTPPAERNQPYLEIVYSCPDRECGRFFIGIFRPSRSRDYQRRPLATFELSSSTPINITPPTVPQEVAALSPSFVDVYTQASAAEAYRLPQVAGPGFRKALEFLVKDYCVTRFPEATDRIRAMMLGPVIKEYVDDPNVKLCAERAAWLGNDETHYVRKWESKDIDDLKTLVRLSVNWIHNHALTQKYVTDMPRGGAV
jgi:hypothetical protein